MTDQEKDRIIVLALGECWHEWEKANKDDDGYFGIRCRVCKKFMTVHFDNRPRNRTFTTPDDFFALVEKIKERGEWDVFFRFAYLSFVHELDSPSYEDVTDNPPTFAMWLIDKDRLPVLVYEAIKVGVIGKETK